MCFSDKKKTQCIINFIATPIFQGYRYSDFLVKHCFGRMSGLVCCKSQLQKKCPTGIHDFSPCIFVDFNFFICICIACFLESDKFVPFPNFSNCSAHMRLQLSIRIVEKSNSCHEKRLQTFGCQRGHLATLTLYQVLRLKIQM